MSVKYDGPIEISTNTGMVRRTGWTVRRLVWSAFAAQLMEHKTTGETLTEWTAKPKDQKDAIKDVGCFVGGALRDGTRKKGFVTTRSLITLDADHAKADLADTFDFLFGCAAVVYQTHSWTPDKPKVRLVVPLSRPVETELFRAISVHMSAELGKEQFDHTCHQPERLMHLPSLPTDVVHRPRLFDAPWLDVDQWVSEHPLWTDISTWPDVGGPAAIKAGTAKKDPREVPGVVGQFCRAYTVPEAIERFLPEVYLPTEEPGRWTFAAGSSVKGLQVFDDGLLALSHHATDPAGDGHEYNAFDLVRIHLFGVLDTDPDKALNERPSSKAMRELAEEDPEVQRVLREETDAAARSAFDDFDETGVANPRAMFFRRVPGMRLPQYTPQLAYRWYTAQHPVTKVGGVLYRYSDGVYVPSESDFRRRLAMALSEEYQSSRVSEALYCAKDLSSELANVMGDEDYINLSNGLFNLKTAALEPHDLAKAGAVRVPWSYDAESECPAFERFLAEYAPGYEQTLWYMLAYPLISSHRFEKTFLLLGAGGNGKGTLLNLLTKMLGDDNVAHLTVHKMEENTFAASGLVGKLANIQMDLPTRAIQPDGVFKTATSGDPITVERKNKDGFSTRLRAKMMFSANDLSGTKDTSDGFFRRWCIIPFNRKFKDKAMREAMFSELPAILSKALRVAHELNGLDAFPDTGLADEYRQQADSVYGFYVECCVPHPDSTISVSDMHQAYRSYCRANNHVDLGRNKFGVRFAQRSGLTQGRNNTMRFWQGVKVTNWDESDIL